MLFRTYKEFIDELKQLLPDTDIILGTTKKSIDRETVFIVHAGSTLNNIDDIQTIASSTYNLVFMKKRPAFTNQRIIEMTNDGVSFSAYDDELGYNIYTADVTLFGPGSVPDE